MQVPLIDLQAQYESIKPEIDEAVIRVLSKGQYVRGEEVEQFESEWARYCKAEYCVAVSNGTDALYLAFAALRRDTGHWLWTTPRTFIAVAEAAQRANFALRFYEDAVPIDNMWDNDAAAPVSLYGMPHNEQWPDRVRVIEDLAQAHGHPLRGFAACFSFYPTKNLGAVGQAGAVVTNNVTLAHEMRWLRDHGEEGERFRTTSLMGGNYRMDELQAAILRVKLPYLDAWNKRRREIAALYCDRLWNIESIRLPVDHPEHVYHVFAVGSLRRDQLAEYLKAKGIQTAVRYPIPLHLQPALAYLGYKRGDFPEAERWTDETLSLPIYPEMPYSMVEYVCENIREWATKCA